MPAMSRFELSWTSSCVLRRLKFREASVRGCGTLGTGGARFLIADVMSLGRRAGYRLLPSHRGIRLAGYALSDGSVALSRGLVYRGPFFRAKSSMARTGSQS